MRWERLFADLEARLEAEERAGPAADVTDLVRAELARLSIVDRLRAHVGDDLSWTLRAGPVLPGRLLDVGVDWVLIARTGGEVLLPMSAVETIGGLTRLSSVDGSQVARRLGIGVVLRGLSRDRATVEVRLAGDRAVVGTIDRVGSDHIDVAVHPRDEVRRGRAVIEVRCLMLAAVVSVTAG